MTGNIIIRPDKFPAGFGQKSREWVAGQLPRAFTILGKMKADIPQKYWMEVPAADKPGYQNSCVSLELTLHNAVFMING